MRLALALFVLFAHLPLLAKERPSQERMTPEEVGRMIIEESQDPKINANEEQMLLRAKLSREKYPDIKEAKALAEKMLQKSGNTQYVKDQLKNALQKRRIDADNYAQNKIGRESEAAAARLSKSFDTGKTSLLDLQDISHMTQEHVNNMIERLESKLATHSNAITHLFDKAALDKLLSEVENGNFKLISSPEINKFVAKDSARQIEQTLKNSTSWVVSSASHASFTQSPISSPSVSLGNHSTALAHTTTSASSPSNRPIAAPKKTTIDTDTITWTVNGITYKLTGAQMKEYRQFHRDFQRTKGRGPKITEVPIQYRPQAVSATTAKPSSYR